jgi:hypothetical protein
LFDNLTCPHCVIALKLRNAAAVSPQEHCVTNANRSRHSKTTVEGCTRRWMNLDDAERQNSGINILWPKTNNEHFKQALADAAAGLSPNNISAIVQYNMKDGPTVLWMGDLDTYFMEDVENDLELSKVDILFAPHHGRDSGTIPVSMLEKLSPKLIVIGEAPSEHLNYYADYDTITQNSAGDITFDCVEGWAHVYVSSATYTCTCLQNLHLPNTSHGYYVGSLAVWVAAGGVSQNQLPVLSRCTA